MRTDTLGRRKRNSSPQPKQHYFVLQPHDLAMFEAIAKHGPLSTRYLYEFGKQGRISYQNCQRRLTELYNGDPSGPFLTRPPRQFDGMEGHYQDLVYDLTPRARIALSEVGRLPKHPPAKTNSFLHDFMVACIGASIELSCKARGYRYISRSELLTHPKSQGHLALPIGTKKLIPDDLFGIEYPEGFRFFALEADRGTEPIRGKGERNTFGKKLTNYLEILNRGDFRTWWGLPGITVLTVATSETRVGHILDELRSRDAKKLAGDFYFAVAPAFGTETYASLDAYVDNHWRVPRALLSHLFEGEWRTLRGVDYINRI
jgi:hypothetical protein